MRPLHKSEISISKCIHKVSKHCYSASVSRLKHNPAYCWNSEQQSIDKAFTPPQEWYTNEEIYNYEQQNVFKKYPQYIGHTQQLTNTKGSYFAGHILNEPFIIIRQNDVEEKNKIGSFFNVCRHHASQLTLSNTGHIDCDKGLICPYHGWTYNVNGQLIKATQLKGIKDFKPKNYGLLSIPNHILFDNLIFLNLSLNDKESSDLFKKVIKSVTNYTEKVNKFNNANLIHVYSRKYVLNCNWKVFVENYLDGGYHVPHLHIGLNNNLNPDSYKTVIDNYVSFQSVQSSTNPNESRKGVDFPDRIGDRGLFTYIYPNFMINRYGRWMDINYVSPKSVNECFVHFDYFIQGTDDINSEIVEITNVNEEIEPQILTDGVYYNLDKLSESDVKFIQKSIVASHQVQVEDMMICEAVSRGLKSSAYNHFKGRYAPQLETALYQFHQLYNTDMFM